MFILNQVVIPGFQCPSESRGTTLATTWQFGGANPVRAMTSYAGSTGSTLMQSLTGCNVSTLVPNPGPLFDPNRDGEDYFSRATIGQYARTDTPNPNNISGVMAQSSWSADLKDITDGSSNTICMGEVRGWCSDALGYWTQGGGGGWADSESLWFSTTAPINFPTCPGERGIPSDAAAAAPCNNVSSWNTAMGFKSQHTGGAHFLLCDGSVRFLSENMDHLTYQKLGDRADGYPVGEF